MGITVGMMVMVSQILVDILCISSALVLAVRWTTHCHHGMLMMVSFLAYIVDDNFGSWRN